jgi:hypothetical protein
LTAHIAANVASSPARRPLTTLTAHIAANVVTTRAPPPAHDVDRA